MHKHKREGGRELMRKRREKEKEEERRRVRNKERKRKVGTRTRADCGPSPVWPCLPFSSTLAVLTTQCPVPRFRVTCCGTVFQVPPQGDTWLSVHTKLTLNKFHYTLYKKARSIPHLTSCLPPKDRPSLPLCFGGPPWAEEEGEGIASFPNGLLCPCIKPSRSLGA